MFANGLFRVCFLSVLLNCALATMSYGAPVNFTDPALESAVRAALVDLGVTPSTPIDDSELVGVGFVELNASGLGIASLAGLEAATELERLTLSNNAISDLSPLSTLTNLVQLDLGINQVADISPLSGLTALEELNLGLPNPFEGGPDPRLFSGTPVNQITNLAPLAGLTNLLSLGLGNNPGITDISVLSGLTTLEFLFLANCPIADHTPIAALTNLSTLITFNTGLTDAQVSTLNNLTNISVLVLASQANLTDISALDAINPQVLALLLSSVSDLSVASGYSNLVELIVFGTPITAFPDLSGTSVAIIEADGCQLSDISGLANVTTLEEIILSNNQLSDLQVLIDNPDIGGDDFLSIVANPLLSGPSPSAACDQIPVLISKFNSPFSVETDAICGDAAFVTINKVGEGFVVPGEGSFPARLGETFLALAFPTAGSGFAFEGWSGDITSGDNVLPILVDGNKDVTATFVSPGDHTLTISYAGGVPPVQLPGEGVHAALDGSSILLLTFGDGESLFFAGYSGDIVNSLPIASVPMDSDKAVVVNLSDTGFSFELDIIGRAGVAEIPLPLAALGGGFGSGFAPGASFNLTAVTEPGWSFQAWEGDIGGADPVQPTLPVTMDQDRNVRLVARPDTGFYLGIRSGNDDAGTTNPLPGFYAVAPDEVTEVSAQPNAGFIFVRWEGDVPAGQEFDNPITLTATGDRIITAQFQEEPAAVLTFGTTGQGTVQVAGGQILGPDKRGFFNLGDQASLQAEAAFGWRFDAWTGDVPPGQEGQNPLNVTMDQDRDITAVFVEVPTLSLNVTGAGTTNPAPGNYVFGDGEQVTLRAFPFGGGEFIEWTGDIGGADPQSSTITVTMNQSRTVTAVFKDYDWTVTVNTVGIGTVSPSNTTFEVFDGTVLNLTASIVADSGFAFSGWTGDAASTDNVLSVVVDSDKVLTANFTDSVDFTLNLSAGTGGTTTPPPGVYSFLDGQTFAATGVADLLFVFDEWTGDVAPAQAGSQTIVLTMDQDRNVQATFNPVVSYTLDLRVLGEGTTLPAPGVRQLQEFTSQLLIAVNQQGSPQVFREWQGDIGDGDPKNPRLTVQMDQDRVITAVFEEPDWELSVRRIGFGVVSPQPGVYPKFEGDLVTLTANELFGSGYRFVGWEGDLGGAAATAPEITVTMDQDRSLTAVFEPENSLFCQQPNPSSTPFVSNDGTGFYTFDSFDGLSQPIAGVRWWGIQAFQEQGGAFPPCTRNPDSFRVVFLADNGGLPGAEIYSEEVSPTGQDTGLDFFQYDILEYAVTLTAPVGLNSGWISIQGSGDTDCWLLWSGSDRGDGRTFQLNTSTDVYSEKSVDSAFCLIGDGTNLEGEGEGSVDPCLAGPFHSADTNSNLRIELQELLRVIQFFNSIRYGCGTGTDGYAPNSTEEACCFHDSDFIEPRNWRIALQELLRAIQFFNSVGYRVCPGEGTADGYCVATQ